MRAVSPWFLANQRAAPARLLANQAPGTVLPPFPDWFEQGERQAVNATPPPNSALLPHPPPPPRTLSLLLNVHVLGCGMGKEGSWGFVTSPPTPIRDSEASNSL